MRRLAKLITDDITFRKVSDIKNEDPDFWLLDKLLTKEEVRFMLSFKKKRVVKLTIGQLAKRNNMTVQEAKKMAHHICEIGLLEFDRENEERRRQYFIPKWVVGSGEYMMMNGALLEKHPEVATFFHYASSVPVGKVAHMVPPGGGGLGMHVIPVEKAIEATGQAVSLEKLSYWLNKYDKYCLDVCSCRRQQRIRGEGDGNVEEYYCIAVGDMAEYLAAKTNVFAHTGCKFFVTNADDPTTAELARTAPVPVALFSLYDDPADRRPRVFPKDGWIVFRGGADERRILPTSAIRVPGRHNLQNFMAAIALTDGFVSPESVAAVAGRFRGVPHRMEKIGTVDGVTYYNSSIDSSPSRTAATLAAFREMGIRPVVICGGYDKKLPFAPLAGALAANAKAVVLTGATAGAIAGAIRACPAAGDLPVRTEPDFEGAVRAARDLAQSGDAVLLSPACASFDAFRNFAERGDAFRSVVERFGR